jgi:acetolactate synthase-1/2/3 large subunit
VVGADSSSGLTLPPLEGIAAAYGLPFVRIDPHGDLKDQLRQVLAGPGPVLCEIPTPPDEPREPGQISEAKPDGGMRSRPLEDLAPLLTREELAENMHARSEDRR